MRNVMYHVPTGASRNQGNWAGSGELRSAAHGRSRQREGRRQPSQQNAH